MYVNTFLSILKCTHSLLNIDQILPVIINKNRMDLYSSKDLVLKNVQCLVKINGSRFDGCFMQIMSYCKEPNPTESFCM